MKRIGTITFHAAHNYGSNLQAYALQQFIAKITNNNYKYDIINFRPLSQINLYKNVFEKKDLKSIVKRFFFLRYKEQLYKREELFENFINNELNITNTYTNEEELNELSGKYDYYICGSDQIWNLSIADSSWAYFLEFTKSGKKISYAPSFGNRNQDLSEENYNRLKSNLKKFDNISVRDEYSKKLVKEVTGITPKILVDPTMLLDYDDWKKLINKEPIEKDKYIFLYDIKGNDETLNIAIELAKIYDLKIITPNLNRKRVHCKNIINKYDCGPYEFLNYIYNSEFVVTSSFHGTVFSLLLKKNFIVTDFVNDNRLNTLCKTFNLDNKFAIFSNFVDSLNAKIDYKSIDKVLEKERDLSKKFILDSIESNK